MASPSKLAIILVALPLAGCGTYQAAPPSFGPPMAAWDGRLQSPQSLAERHPRNFFAEANAPADAAAEESQLAQHPKYSAEWWAIRHAFDQREEVRLAKATTICRGCEGLPLEQTASIGRTGHP